MMFDQIKLILIHNLFSTLFWVRFWRSFVSCRITAFFKFYARFLFARGFIIWFYHFSYWSCTHCKGRHASLWIFIQFKSLWSICFTFGWNLINLSYAYLLSILIFFLSFNFIFFILFLINSPTFISFRSITHIPFFSCVYLSNLCHFFSFVSHLPLFQIVNLWIFNNPRLWWFFFDEAGSRHVRLLNLILLR